MSMESDPDDAGAVEDRSAGPGENRPAHDPDHPDHEVGRLLVIAAAALDGDELKARVLQHLEGRGSRVHIVAPALTENSFEHAMGDVDGPRSEATETMDRSIDALEGEGLVVSGDIGDSDPLLAIEDAVGTFDPQEILVVTHPHDEGRWLEDDIFDRARKTYGLPIVHAVVDSGGTHVTEVEESGFGVDGLEEPEAEGQSDNTPRFSIRDVVGIFVAIVGTITLVVLAGSTSGGPDRQDFDWDSVVTLIAGVTALINVAHVVALTLFESVGYRGGWQRAFANLSLVLTPVAIVAVLVIGLID